jgi:hypothetical protein
MSFVINLYFLLCLCVFRLRRWCWLRRGSELTGRLNSRRRTGRRPCREERERVHKYVQWVSEFFPIVYVFLVPPPPPPRARASSRVPARAPVLQNAGRKAVNRQFFVIVFVRGQSFIKTLHGTRAPVNNCSFVRLFQFQRVYIRSLKTSFYFSLKLIKRLCRQRHNALDVYSFAVCVSFRVKQGQSMRFTMRRSMCKPQQPTVTKRPVAPPGEWRRGLKQHGPPV